MKNLLFLLLLIFITSCDKNDELPTKTQAQNNPMQLYIINGDIEYYSEITDGSKPKKPIFIYDTPNKTEEINSSTSKVSEESTTLDFRYGDDVSTKSGCTIDRYYRNNFYKTDKGVYGPNPHPYHRIPSCLIRGFGKPHQNLYYNCLVLFAGNKEFKTRDRRGIMHRNKSHGSAISIEYPFKANVTYEITTKVSFRDNRYLINKVFSNGYPTMFVQLKDSGVIIPKKISRTQKLDPCTKEGVIDLTINNYNNLTRFYTLDSRPSTMKNLVFKFSPTEQKNALSISLHPAISPIGYGVPIETNNYTMTLATITITEKPFAPSLNIELPEIPYIPRR